MNILIIEDDQMQRKALSFYLLERGHTVSAAANGKEALAVIEQNRSVEMILCDLLMPEMSGPSFLMNLKKILPHHLPVITIITSVKDGKVFLQNLGVQYDHYLQKPLDYGQLDTIISSSLT